VATAAQDCLNIRVRGQKKIFVLVIFSLVNGRRFKIKYSSQRECLNPIRVRGAKKDFCFSDFFATSDRGQLRRFRPRLTVPPAMLVAADEVIE
jgi:hypothetical protein